MSIYAIDKWDGDRDNKIIAHRNNDLIPYYILPKTDDDSDEWKEVQAWLDAGNEITDNLKYAADTAYIGKRVSEYPSIVDQLDDIYHNGVDAWKATIKAIKDANPKP
jgi:hypothetical protein|tara:strand:+ start:608 stop:928 length:321 start_codon:yes stop_codon:yes gene_type:complete